MTFVGAIGNMRPSDIFHTGWSLNPNVNIHPEIKLIVTLEPLENIQTQIQVQQETDFNKEYAKKVAQNLFNYLQSFEQNEQMQA